ncbi:MAG TPA: hypothetical protein DEP53_14655 [Bacteroidetes bacterium]|nr:hypothetical protein [Bacteroidota bacterium]
MKILEIYDGESRSRAWWSVIRRHTAFFALALAVATLAGYGILIGSYAGGGVLDGVLISLAVFLMAWPSLIGLSMLAPRFAFSLYYWNGWLFLILLFPAALVSGFVLHTSLGDIGAALTFFAVVIIAIAVKTAILHRRFTMVASDKGKQQLPL